MTERGLNRREFVLGSLALVFLTECGVRPKSPESAPTRSPLPEKPTFVPTIEPSPTLEPSPTMEAPTPEPSPTPINYTQEVGYVGSDLLEIGGGGENLTFLVEKITPEQFREKIPESTGFSLVLAQGQSEQNILVSVDGEGKYYFIPSVFPESAFGYNNQGEEQKASGNLDPQTGLVRYEFADRTGYFLNAVPSDNIDSLGYKNPLVVLVKNQDGNFNHLILDRETGSYQAFTLDLSEVSEAVVQEGVLSYRNGLEDVIQIKLYEGELIAPAEKALISNEMLVGIKDWPTEILEAYAKVNDFGENPELDRFLTHWRIQMLNKLGVADFNPEDQAQMLSRIEKEFSTGNIPVEDEQAGRLPILPMVEKELTARIPKIVPSAHKYISPSNFTEVTPVTPEGYELYYAVVGRPVYLIPNHDSKQTSWDRKDRFTIMLETEEGILYPARIPHDLSDRNEIVGVYNHSIAAFNDPNLFGHYPTEMESDIRQLVPNSDHIAVLKRNDFLSGVVLPGKDTQMWTDSIEAQLINWRTELNVSQIAAIVSRGGSSLVYESGVLAIIELNLNGEVH